MKFIDKLAGAQQRNDSWLCVGLDILASRMPLPLQPVDDPVLPFAREIVDATRDLVCAYKPTLGFFLAGGAAGAIALERLMRYIPADIPVILDACWGGSGPAAEQYAQAAFEAFGADAVTLACAGPEVIKPFLQYEDRGVFILAGQGLGESFAGQAAEWNRQGPGACGLAVAAGAFGRLQAIRQRAPGLPLLVLDGDAQGDDWEAAVRYGPARPGLGPVINVSRRILYASGRADFADQARAAAARLRDEINALSRSPR